MQRKKADAMKKVAIQRSIFSLLVYNRVEGHENNR